ncbi:MAG: c-type cytochrome [Marinovum algicola]|jgi:mono/diheme cytochrome c family protein|uniref:Cytochrome c553 n=1 Tax=Marinovum algicola TaxID=42444 RepID=A0A975ZMX2_9RHOB|nr:MULTISPECIES: cytochrome c [Marinovum]AKO98364.1 Cytochrome c553 [Marinovum algicola DG 898]MDD9740529.1 c-type cytochrome [Marinovum sp. SP66]MDD9745989.1 c-type cytochrome [Marinovum sp. PR37]SEJ23692.1 Cytochrome c553 [Marinovum algicola]SLN48096.1 Cytochrome c [Marinovum algicola]
MLRQGIILAAMALAGPLAAASDRPEDAAGEFPYWDEAEVARGATLYAETCAACHGAALEGAEDWRGRNEDGSFRAPPHDETGHTWHHADAQLFAITKFGTEEVTGGAVVSDMQGFGEVLTDDEIRAVLAFIKAQWPERVIARHNELNRRFEAQQQ